MKLSLLRLAASSILCTVPTLTAAAPAGAVTAPLPGAVTCSLEGHLRLDPGVSVTPSAGTVWSDVPAIGECSGLIGGSAFSAAPALLNVTGTYGDGPLSAPTGGATCGHNDGSARGVLVANVAGRTLRVTADYAWLRTVRTGAGRGSMADGYSTAVMSFFPDAGQNCLQVPITGLRYTIDLEVHGAMELIYEPSAPWADVATSANLIRGTGPVKIAASVDDADGLTDLRSIDLRISDGQGRTVARWDGSAFSPTGDTTTSLTADVRLTGVSPWVVELLVVDRGGHSGADRETIVRS